MKLNLYWFIFQRIHSALTFGKTLLRIIALSAERKLLNNRGVILKSYLFSNSVLFSIYKCRRHFKTGFLGKEDSILLNRNYSLLLLKCFGFALKTKRKLPKNNTVIIELRNKKTPIGTMTLRSFINRCFMYLQFPRASYCLLWTELLIWKASDCDSSALRAVPLDLPTRRAVFRRICTVRIFRYYPDLSLHKYAVIRRCLIL